jgi:hypothetical protein
MVPCLPAPQTQMAQQLLRCRCTQQIYAAAAAAAKDHPVCGRAAADAQASLLAPPPQTAAMDDRIK